MNCKNFSKIALGIIFCFSLCAENIPAVSQSCFDKRQLDMEKKELRREFEIRSFYYGETNPVCAPHLNNLQSSYGELLHKAQQSPCLMSRDYKDIQDILATLALLKPVVLDDYEVRNRPSKGKVFDKKSYIGAFNRADAILRDFKIFRKLGAGAETPLLKQAQLLFGKNLDEFKEDLVPYAFIDSARNLRRALINSAIARI